MKQLQMLKAALLAVMLTLSGLAAAALPPEVATSMTSVQTDAGNLFALAFPVIAAVVGLTIVVKLFKRFINKV